MDKKTIIDIIINHKPYKRYCDKLANYTDIANDLYQEFFLFMYDKPDQEIIKIYRTGGLEKYCLCIIYNKSKWINKKWKLKGAENPLLSIASFMSNIENHEQIEDDGYSQFIDENYEKIMDYVISDESISIEDFLILTESMNSKGLIKLSRETGISYDTLNKKRKRIKDKIKQNVSI